MGLFWRMGVYVLEPEGTRCETVFVGYVEADDDALGVSVVHPGDLAETLLAGCVPHEETHSIGSERVVHRQIIGWLSIGASGAGVQLNGFDFEVPAESGLRAVLSEDVRHVALDQRGFADHAFAHADYFKLLHAEGLGAGVVWPTRDT